MASSLRKNPLVAPVVKWAGGKRQLASTLKALLPPKKDEWCEPFAGGAALLFELQPRIAQVNDINQDLIGAYSVIKSDVEALIRELETYKNNPDFFYFIRDFDRDKKLYKALSEIKKAARLIYLNKTCYNGLFRVNNAGEFNTPFGYYKNPNIVNAPTLRAVSEYFNNNKISLSALSYEKVLENLSGNSFVYLDPPYDPVTNTSSFTGYARGGFSREDQIKLRKECDKLNERKIHFMLSNSDTEFIREQYSRYRIESVSAKRFINSNVLRRGDVKEVVVMNYE